MTKQVQFNNITDQTIGARAKITQLAGLREDGIGAAKAYATAWLQLQATGSSEVLGDTGDLRVEAQYTDGTKATIYDDESDPFDGITALTSAFWVVLKVGSRGGVDKVSYTPSTTPNIATLYQLTISQSKTLAQLNYFWHPA